MGSRRRRPVVAANQVRTSSRRRAARSGRRIHAQPRAMSAAGPPRGARPPQGGSRAATSGGAASASGQRRAMLPLDALPASALAAMQGVFTDIDDTLTTRGSLTAHAYAAMQRLHDAGVLLIPVTCRPAGWCDHIARMWPVSAVVGENGALYMRHDAAARKLRVRHLLDAQERERNRGRLAAIGERIVREVPGCALASDQRFRESDL